MSPSWREVLRIGVCPDRLLLAHYARGLRPALRGRRMVSVQPEQEGSWKETVTALSAIMAAQRPCDVNIVLSNHFVRYAALPWRPDLKDAAEWTAAARHAYTTTHGQAARNWHVAVSSAQAQFSRLASAIDADLLENLKALCAERRSRLVSVQPYFITAFNQVRKQVPENGWFAVAESGRVALGRIEKHGWQSIRNRALGEASIADLLLREAALQGEAGEDMVFVGEHPPPAALAQSFRLQTLSDPGPEARPYAMVMQ